MNRGGNPSIRRRFEWLYAGRQTLIVGGLEIVSKL
jgi:hypothetical protein